MCVAWKISPSLSCYVDNESIPLQILFISISKPSSGTSTNPCFPLRRAYPFTFMQSHHPLIKKALAGEHSRHLHSSLLIYIGYDYDWISFTMNNNVSLLGKTLYTESQQQRGLKTDATANQQQRASEKRANKQHGSSSGLGETSATTIIATALPPGQIQQQRPFEDALLLKYLVATFFFKTRYC